MNKRIIEVSNKSLYVMSDDWTEKFHSKEGREKKLQFFNNFIKEIGPKNLTLNHLGISYCCKNLKEETHKLNDLLSPLPVFEEIAESKNQKWIFTGDSANWREPMFEFVLNNSNSPYIKGWVPHFQMDIDTNLSEKELKKKIKKYFGPRFIKWQLTFPDIGTVVFMGIIENIGDNKIALALRPINYTRRLHRQDMTRIK